jgi:NAD(P)-dependent dehydrogenase (short-subunit alcohol dehydrogenase family)
MLNSELAGRRALVTGSTDGIGVTLARRIAQAGATLGVTGRDAARGEAVRDAITADGGAATFIRADLGEGEAAIAALVRDAEAALGGPVDLLVNNAALLVDPAPTADVDQALIDRAFAVSVRSAFLLTGRIAPKMVAQGSGAIVNLGSNTGFRGNARSALYSATKATMHSLTQSWAAEYGPAGVRVNAVAPGPTLTDKVRGWSAVIEPMVARFPSGRANSLDEVAEAVLFLAGDRAANIHGAILPVDGGATAV